MSEYLPAAAKNMGLPEALVMRSAEAKAKAQGVTVEDLLREWAGGEAATPAAEPAAAPPPPASAESAATDPEPPASPPAPVVPRRHVVARRDPDAAPLLVGVRQGHVAMILTIVAVLAVGAALGALFPVQAARQEVNDAIGTQPDYTDQAIDGRAIYLAEGCWTCHTMVVRATATDYGLGNVTTAKDVAPLPGETLGARRIGPDLAHIGARKDPASLYNFLLEPSSVADGARHPGYSFLSEDELGALTAFLIETK